MWPSPFAFLVCLLLHFSTLGVAIKGATSFPPKRKVAGSCRVLTTMMNNGQELLLVLAPSTSLCPRVQQGLRVMPVTDAHAYFTQAKFAADHKFDCPFRALDPLRNPAWPAFWRVSSQSLIKPDGESTLGIVGSIVICLSLLWRANAFFSFTIIAVDQRPLKAESPPTLHSRRWLCRVL